MNVNNLIALIFKRKPLWDQKHPDHHNRYALDKKWDEVAADMETTRDVVRAKWKTLRDTFRKELQKKPVSHCGDDGSETYWKSRWIHFDSLLFLKDQFTPRCSGVSLPEVTTDSFDSKVAIDDILIPDVLMDDSDAASTATPNPSTYISTDKVNRKRRIPCDEIGKALIRLEERKLDMLEKNQTRSPTAVDDDEAFFNSLLPHVRPLPQANKLLLRIKIQQLVYDSVKLAAQSG